MLDIRLVRSNPDLVKENIKKKFQDEKLVLVDEVLELDKQFRDAKSRGDYLRGQRNTLSKQIGGLMAKGQKEEAEQVKAQVTAMAQELEELDALFARREFTDAYLDGRADDAAGTGDEPERDDIRTAERAMSAERRVYANRELRRVRVKFFIAAKHGRPLLAGIQDMDGNRAEYKGPVVGDVPGAVSSWISLPRAAETASGGTRQPGGTKVSTRSQ